MKTRNILVAVLLFLVFITSCTQPGNEQESGVWEWTNEQNIDKMLRADVKVNEINKSRTHSFELFFDPQDNITALVGSFSIEGKLYPGRILYTKDKSILLRESPDQCVTFPKNYGIFGFMPPHAVISVEYDPIMFEITVDKKDDEGFPLKYRIFSYDTLQDSTVEITPPKFVPYQKSRFQLPDDRECFNHVITV